MESIDKLFSLDPLSETNSPDGEPMLFESSLSSLVAESKVSSLSSMENSCAELVLLDNSLPVDL